MPTTSRTSTPYPAYSDVPDVPADLQALILALEPYTNLRYATTTARDVDITAPVQGMMCEVAGQPYIYDGSAWKKILIEGQAIVGTSVAFTPSWQSATLGTGALNEGWYTALGDLVHWQVRLVFGTSPSITTTLGLTLPITAWTGSTPGFQQTFGSWLFRTGTTVHYAGTVAGFDTGGTQATFSGAFSPTTSKPEARISTGIPFTVGAGDILTAGGVYKKL